MKLHTETTPIEKSGHLTEQTFTIKATGKAFSILSSGLYSNKILAVVRELSCNAYDSHVAAGKADVPIEIKLPSVLDPTFYVKDFGTGLSNEQVLALYTTYFDSTKQNSNDFIGALGLGSKSPFSYTSTFMVESRFGGEKHFYSCYLNEQQLPSIVKMSETEMEPGESSGMTIMLSVKRDDIYKFSNEAKKALMYFNPIPVILGHPGFKPHSLKHTVVGSNWKIRQADYYAYMSGPYVVQGFVAYPINGSIVKEYGLTQTAAALIGVGIDLSVAIGDVEVAASREALQYDKRTIANLVQVFEQAAIEIRDSFQTSFDKCTTAWEVGLLLDELETSESYEFRNIFANLNREKPFTWNGKEVSQTLHLDMSSIKTTQIGVYNVKKSGLQVQTSNTWTPPVSSFGIVDWDVKVSKTTHVIVDTETNKNRDIYRRYLNSLPNTGSLKKLIVIRPINKKLYNQSEIDALLKSIGNSDYKHVADLGFVSEKKVSSYKKKDNSEKLVWTGFTEKQSKHGLYTHKVYSRNTWNTKSVNMKEGGFYVPIERFSPIYKDQTFSDLPQFIDHAKKLKILPQTHFPIYGFTQADINNLDDNSEWVDLFEYIKTKFVRMNSTGQLTNRDVYENICEYISSDFILFTVGRWTNIESTITKGKFKTFFSKLVEMSKDVHLLPRQHVSGLAYQLDIKILSNSAFDALKQEWATLKTTYEMLECVNSYMKEPEVSRMLRYVNLVEQKTA